MIVIVLPDIVIEDQLLARARRGDLDSMREIYEQYFPPVYEYIRLRVEDVQTAKDMGSEVFLKLVEAFRRRKMPHHSLRGWLFTVARNEVYAHYGKKQRLRHTVIEEWMPAPAESEPEVAFIRNLDIDLARQAIRQLSPEQQEVIILRFGQMLSLQETASIMGANLNTVKSHQLRALQTLRHILSEMRLRYGE